MKTAFSTVALTATLALHVALIAVVVSDLTIYQDKPADRSPIAVQLLPPAAESTPPPALPMAAVAEPPQPEQKRPQPKRIARPKPAPKPRETPTREAQRPPPVESKPAPADTNSLASAPATTPVPAAQAAPSAPAAPPGPPAPPAAPITTGVSIPASYAASNRKPDYPTLSRRYEEQGTVVLQVLVKADGTAGEVKLKTSSGHPLLDKSAMSTVRSWRFIAATRDGKAVAEWYPVPITFTLQN
jgi:protein TonB